MYNNRIKGMKHKPKLNDMKQGKESKNNIDQAKKTVLSESNTLRI